MSINRDVCINMLSSALLTLDEVEQHYPNSNPLLESARKDLLIVFRQLDDPNKPIPLWVEDMCKCYEISNNAETKE